jgi:hypothetical protein
MQKIRTPYELLQRFDKDGNYIGAAVIWRTVAIDEDGTPFGEKMEQEELDIAIGKGFAIDGIMAEIHAGAVRELEKSKGRVTELEEANDKLGSEKAELAARADALENSRSTLAQMHEKAISAAVIVAEANTELTRERDVLAMKLEAAEGVLAKVGVAA